MPLPVLYSDDRERLLQQLFEISGKDDIVRLETTEQLKDRLDTAILKKKTSIVEHQIRNLKSIGNMMMS